MTDETGSDAEHVPASARRLHVGRGEGPGGDDTDPDGGLGGGDDTDPGSKRELRGWAIAAIFVALAGFGLLLLGGSGSASGCASGYGYGYGYGYGDCPAGTATISGTVVQSGTGAIVHVVVDVSDAAGHHWSTGTSSTGGFVVDSLPAGTYTVKFSGSALVTQWYLGATAAGDATPVSLADAESRTGVDAAMAVTAPAISGTVTDAVTGDPIAGACVNATAVSGVPGPVFSVPSSFCAGVLTGPSGQYAIGVSTGDWKVGVTDPQARYVAEWYHDQPTLATADVVTVGAGGAVADLALDHGGTISGTVRDSATSAPLASKSLFLWPAGSSGTLADWPPTAQLVTAADGTYHTPPLAAGDYILQALPNGDPNYLPQWYAGAADAATATPITVTVGTDAAGMDLALVAGGHISGTVLDAATHAPISGDFVSVDLYDAGTGQPAGGNVAFVNPFTGAFTTGALAPGSYVAHAPSYAGSSYLPEYYQDSPTLAGATPITITGSETVSGITMELSRKPRITGTVVDEVTGDPVSGVQVSATDVNTSDPFYFPPTVSTGADGTFTLSLVPGQYKVCAFQYGGAHAPECYDDAPTIATAQVIDLQPDNDVTGLTIALAARHAIHGVVTDASTGLPVQGVSVAAASPSSPTGSLAFATSGVDGSYTLPVVDGSYLVHVTDSLDRYVEEWYQDQPTYSTAAVVTVTGADVTADVAVDRGGTLSGTLRDASTHATVPSLAVAIYDAGQNQVATVSADGAGNYRSPALPAGEYSVQALPYGDTTYVSSWYDGAASFATATPVTVTVGDDQGGVDFDLTSTTVSGTITDAATGDPIANAWVYAYDDATSSYHGPTYTDAAGHYSLGLPDGSYAVWAGANGYPYASTPSPVVVSGTSVTGVDLQLGGATIQGTITGSDTGDPLPNVCLAAGGASICTGSGGAYELHVLPGTYSVAVDPQLGSAYLGTTLDDGGPGYTLALGDTVTADAQLELGARVSGHVTDAVTGAPLQNICVEVFGAAFASTCTDSSGQYTTNALPTGTYTVDFANYSGRYVTEWYDDAFDQASATPVALTAGTDATGIDAGLTLGGRIHGTITQDGTGSPVAGACVDVVNDDATQVVASACSGADGTYSVNGIRPGTWKVRFAAAGMATEYWNDATDVGDGTSVNVVSGDDHLLDVSLAPPAGGVAGHAQDAAAVPVDGVCAYLYDQAQVTYQGLAYCTGADGAFAFAGLAPGSYSVAVSDPSGRYRTGWQPLTVTAGSDVPITVTLAADGSVSGVVRDPLGTPLQGVCAYLYDTSGTTYEGVGTCTGGDGSYLLDVSGLPTGDYVVRAFDPQARWASSSSAVVHAGGISSAQTDVTMPPAASIAGRVTDAVTGDGIGSACVYLYDSGGAPAGYATCTRPDGYYALAGVPDGDYKVGIADTTGLHHTFWSGAGTDVGSAGTVVVAATGVTAVDAPLAPLSGVTVTAKGTDGSPIDGVCLYLVHTDGNYAGIATCSGADGVLSVLAPAGDYDLVTSDPLGRFVTTWSGGAEQLADAVPVTVGPGLTDAGVVTMRGLGSISGTVVDSDGHPVVGVTVYLDHADGTYAQRYGVTDANGSYTILGLPEGGYKAGFYPPGMGSPTTIWNGGAADEASAPVVTVSSGGTVTGVDATVPASP